MATTKKTSAEAKLTPAQMKKEIERLNNASSLGLIYLS